MNDVLTFSLTNQVMCCRVVSIDEYNCCPFNDYVPGYIEVARFMQTIHCECQWLLELVKSSVFNIRHGIRLYYDAISTSRTSSKHKMKRILFWVTFVNMDAPNWVNLLHDVTFLLFLERLPHRCYRNRTLWMLVNKLGTLNGTDTKNTDLLSQCK
jgi:hypothetical protein